MQYAKVNQAQDHIYDAMVNQIKLFEYMFSVARICPEHTKTMRELIDLAEEWRA